MIDFIERDSDNPIVRLLSISKFRGVNPDEFFSGCYRPEDIKELEKYSMCISDVICQKYGAKKKRIAHALMLASVDFYTFWGNRFPYGEERLQLYKKTTKDFLDSFIESREVFVYKGKIREGLISSYPENLRCNNPFHLKIIA